MREGDKKLNEEFMENDKKEDQLSELIKIGLSHSIAQAFLIFSGAFVIVSVWKENNILLSFFTLFYALINFKIEATRKHLSLGNYGMRDNFGSGLFTIISWSLLIWWIVGVILLLNCAPLVYIFSNCLFLLLTIIWLACLIIWLALIFNRKKEENNSALYEQNKNSYNVDCVCKNCDLSRSLEIPRGIKVVDLICPDCGIAQQLKRKKDEKKS